MCSYHPAKILKIWISLLYFNHKREGCQKNHDMYIHGLYKVIFWLDHFPLWYRKRKVDQTIKSESLLLDLWRHWWPNFKWFQSSTLYKNSLVLKLKNWFQRWHSIQFNAGQFNARKKNTIELSMEKRMIDFYSCLIFYFCTP